MRQVDHVRSQADTDYTFLNLLNERVVLRQPHAHFAELFVQR
jgi:hypothetical protein